MSTTPPPRAPKIPISKASVNVVKPGLGAVLRASTIGFISSSRRAHSAEASINGGGGYDRLKPSVKAFRTFLTTTGIDLEVSSALNLQLLPRLGLLSQIQTILNERNDRREMATVRRCQNNNKNRADNLPSSQEALKYMRYATAVYGKDMIAAAQLGKPAVVVVNNKVTKEMFINKPQPKTTRTWISEHINIPEDDIVVLDVDILEDTNHNHLRYFVAVDHACQKIVLTIRGTFTLSEIVVDITAFSKPCFGGEAHSEIVTMAERIWAATGEALVDLLRHHPTYELIVTGHSLGAGCACVINMMCQENNRALIDYGRPNNIRCFAFACPPVFTDLELVKEAVATTTNYILEQDIVPFLSVDSVRHVFHCVKIIEDYMQTNMTTTQRLNLTMARTLPPPEMIDAVHQASGSRLKPKQGAPVLSIPAAANVWMKEQQHLLLGRHGGAYDFEVCDSTILSWLGLNVDVAYFQYHLPPRYEYALEKLMDEI